MWFLSCTFIVAVQWGVSLPNKPSTPGSSNTAGSHSGSSASGGGSSASGGGSSASGGGSSSGSSASGGGGTQPLHQYGRVLAFYLGKAGE